jgi:hypothetical protein
MNDSIDNFNETSKAVAEIFLFNSILNDRPRNPPYPKEHFEILVAETSVQYVEPFISKLGDCVASAETGNSKHKFRQSGYGIASIYR